MMDGSPLVETRNTMLYLQGRRLGVKSAFVGSIVFAFTYLVSLYVNTYLIERIDAPLDGESIFVSICWSAVIVLLGSALAYFPASYLGGFLANLLEKDASKHALSKGSAFAKGALVGAVGGCIICLPILILEFLFILLIRQGNLIPFFYLFGEVIVIASFLGGWAGGQIEKLIIK